MEEQEIELRDYINVLVKRKKLIIRITLVAVITTGILSYFVLPPIYKGYAVVLPAQIGLSNLLSLSDIQAQIESPSFIQKLSNDLNVPFEEIKGDMNDSIPQGSSFVVVEFESKNKQLIANFFDKLLLELNTFNIDNYNKQMEILKSKIVVLSKQLDLLKSEESLIIKRIEQLEKNSNVNEENFLEYLLLIDLRNGILTKKMDLENTLNDINVQLESSHKFEYLSKPFISDTPIKPSKVFNMAIAGVVALFFSILLAFFLEYWYRAKSENK